MVACRRARAYVWVALQGDCPYWFSFVGVQVRSGGMRRPIPKALRSARAQKAVEHLRAGYRSVSGLVAMPFDLTDTYHDNHRHPSQAPLRKRIRFIMPGGLTG